MAIFDHRKWHPDKEVLEASYQDEMTELFNAYSNFFSQDVPAVTVEDVLEQWNSLKEEIRKAPGLMARKFHDLWAHMLVGFSDEYPLALRIVAISLLLPTDTSECERIFSLMNDLKTAQRSSMKQDALKNLMLWHTYGKDLSCKDVPVMAILKKFKERAGIRGRNKHVGTNPPKYDYVVKAEVDND